MTFIVLAVIIIFLVGRQYESFSHPFIESALQFGVIRTDQDVPQAIYDRLLEDLRRFPNHPPYAYEWKRQTFLENLFSDGNAEDNSSQVLIYSPSNQGLTLEGPLGISYDWEGVTPSHIERAIKERIPLSKFHLFGCKDKRPG